MLTRGHHGTSWAVLPVQQKAFKGLSRTQESRNPHHNGPVKNLKSGVIPSAVPAFANLLKLFDKDKAQQQRLNRYRRASAELLSLLTTGKEGSSRDSSTRRQQQLSSRVDELLDILLSCEGMPFNEQLLSEGPWLVLYSRGTLQLWRATYKAGKLLNTTNTASQEFDPSSKTVMNKAQYAGRQLYVTASGTYQAVDGGLVLPKVLQANITSGQLHLFGVDLPLPIRGTGRFEVVYVDQQLRVFRSGGAISVQVKQKILTERD